jgi:hypothetical protein
MKIVFKKIDSDMDEIFLGDLRLGTVSRNIWTQKWTIKPEFKFSGRLQKYLYEEYNSSYKAGKELVELYNKTQEKSKISLKKNEWDYDPWGDTQEMDMRSIFNTLDP